MRDEKAVSPVIGVILMVAITVILAAVIASFVFGLGSTVKRTYNVAAVAYAIDSDGNGSSDTITIVYHGGTDAQYVSEISYVIDNTTTGTLCGGDSGTNCKAGVSAQKKPGKGQHSVVVAARFQDGTEQVILTTTVTTAE